MEKYEEYQGFDSLMYAEITEDASSSFTVGTPKLLAPAGEISKSTETPRAVKYYDNIAFMVVTAEGSDTINLTVPVLPISQVGELLGKTVDDTTGALLDTGVTKSKYFAIGYRLRFTDDTHRFVWRLKGTFSLDNEEAKSQADNTDTNNQQLVFTGIKTKYKFSMPDGSKKGGKAVVVDERDGLADVEKWFDQVVTPETLSAITPEPPEPEGE